MIAVGDFDFCHKPIYCVQCNVTSSFLFNQGSWVPMMRAKKGTRPILPHIKLPHVEVAVKAIVVGKHNTSTYGIDFKLYFDGVVIGNAITPRLNACHDDKHHQ